MRRFIALLVVLVGVSSCSVTDSKNATMPLMPDGMRTSLTTNIRTSEYGDERRSPSPTSTTTTTTTAAPRRNAVAYQSVSSGNGDVWWALAGCETGGKYDNPVSPNGLYFGYFQFDISTWHSVGGTGNPREHPYEVQKQFAIILQSRSGWGKWPYCSRVLGLR